MTVNVIDYTSGEKLGTITISDQLASEYQECAANAFQWPEGIARAGDVFTDAVLERAGIDGGKVIWLDI